LAIDAAIYVGAHKTAVVFVSEFTSKSNHVLFGCLPKVIVGMDWFALLLLFLSPCVASSYTYLLGR